MTKIKHVYYLNFFKFAHMSTQRLWGVSRTMHVIDGIRNESDTILRAAVRFVYPWLTL